MIGGGEAMEEEKKYLVVPCTCVNLMSRGPWFGSLWLEVYAVIAEHCEPVSEKEKQDIEGILSKMLFEEDFFKGREFMKDLAICDLETNMVSILQEYFGEKSDHDVKVIVQLAK